MLISVWFLLHFKEKLPYFSGLYLSILSSLWLIWLICIGVWEILKIKQTISVGTVWHGKINYIDEKYPHLMLGDFETMNFNRKTYSEVKTTFGSVVSEQTEQTGEKM